MGRFTPSPACSISPASNIFFGGDSNAPGVWLQGKLKRYESNYPQNGNTGGVSAYSCYNPNIETLVTGGQIIAGGRQYLDTRIPPAYGPWFEGMEVDENGVAYAYYHTEIRIYGDTKFHVGIGAQKSTDGGITWTDIGMSLIVDTPLGSDVPQGTFTNLGFGFMGGNGDCSVMLDANNQYLYIIWSQYGLTSANQGIAMGRMLWSDRDSPAGKVYKLFNGTWSQPGAGGLSSPVIPNGGDCYGLFAAQDYWWGPSIHWNEYLEKYVLMLNRSNNGGFTWSGGQTNYWCYSDSLESGIWSTPQPLVFPANYMGDWYPVVYGLQEGIGTDKICGEVGRLSVNGQSNWRITFSREFQDPSPPTIYAGRRSGAHI